MFVRKERKPLSYRENVSYAVGDPLGVFSHIPHYLTHDDGVYLPKESVQLLWESLHPDWGKEHDREAL